MEFVSSGQRHVVLHVKVNDHFILVGWSTSRHGQLGNPSNTPFSSNSRISHQNDPSIEILVSSSLDTPHCIFARLWPDLGPWLRSQGSTTSCQMP